MKYLMFLLGLVISLTVHAQKINSTDPEVFTASFVNAVLTHDQELTMKHMDKRYAEEQYKAFLGKNKTQFLDELFSGTTLNSEEWVPTKFLEIQSITVLSIDPNGLEGWKVLFLVKSSKTETKCTLWIRKTGKGKRTKLGFEGAYG
jgi:hypothetical protein